MKIAQVAPLAESVPPQLYGGTERIVSWLTDELVRQGHRVTLYASGDSDTRARLVPVTPTALRLRRDVVDPLPHLVQLVERVAADADQFDVLHFHIDHLHYPLLRRLSTPGITTMHGRMDLADLPPLFEAFRETPLVSISDSQRRPIPWANWVATVPHGLPLGQISATTSVPDDAYLAFLGRTSPEKGIEEAIEIAYRVGRPLRVAAKVDDADSAYFAERVQPLLERGNHVEFVGEISDAQKDEFLGSAAATLFPIDWPEPFGLVMVESAARGTPVLAFRSGAVPEVIEDGVTGLIVDNVDEAVAAMPRVLALPRDRVRAGIERRFDVARMARDYVAVYERLIAQRVVRALPDVPDFGIAQETPLEPTDIIDPKPAVTSTIS
ncbi:MAG TPA: glycosyltransferase family 4 protein [Candidatus Limnocylindria bacterium]|jgi:glycosyltransferase involved in cell wall biosynthesis